MSIRPQGPFSRAVFRRKRRGVNNLIGVYGERGIGKSCAALKLCETWDPNFSVENCCFDVEDALQRLDSLDYSWGWIVLDEAGMVGSSESGGAAPSREFMSFRNKATGSVVQTLRTEEKASLFVVSVLPYHHDIMLRQLSDFWIRVYDRGRASVYSLKINIFRRGEKQTKTPFLCRIKLALPTEDLFKEYQAKRERIVKQRRKEYLEDMRRQRERQRADVDKRQRIIEEIKQEYLRGEIKKKDLALIIKERTGLSQAPAYDIRKQILREAEESNEDTSQST